MHEEDTIDTEAAQKRVDAILHEQPKPPRKRRSDAGKPKAKKAQEQPEIVTLNPFSCTVRDWRVIANLLDEDMPGFSQSIRDALIDKLQQRIEKLEKGK